MEVPSRLLDEARRRGIDIVEVISRTLSLDPKGRAEAHLELAVKFFGEGRAMVDKDPVQASEKLYRAAEEAVKALAISLGLKEAEEALEMGRWTATLLFNAASSIADRLSLKEVRLWWRVAWTPHVEGLHEARLGSGEVARDVEYIQSLVELAKKNVTNAA